MRDPVRRIFLFAFIQVIFLSACGGSDGLLSGGGTTTGGGGTSGGNTIASAGPNVASVTVDAGPSGAPAGIFNIPYVNVTVCAPGSTTNCQTIDHVEVDTTSYGLRIMGSVLSSSMLAALQVETSPVGAALVECTQFGDGIAWGPMVTADVTVSSEKAASLPIQIMGDPNYPDSGIPTDCASHGSAEDTVALFGANGIIGIGPFAQDCGSFCAGSTEQNDYFNCPTATTCNDVDAPVNLQAANPVPAFTTDNNGIILELPAITDSGSATVTGALVFGINTESNNTLASTAKVFTTDDVGDISIIFNGVTYSESFLDSGSNYTFFSDSSITSCGTAPNEYFCPSSELALSATVEGQSGTEETVSFNVTNINNLSASFAAFDNVAAPNDFAGQSEVFDFGLPFFYGRNVYSAIDAANTGSGGVGPYVAF
jgi:hypothetical protein